MPGATVTHAFATAGTHTATLTVTDPTNLSAMATASVTVSSPPGGPGPTAGQASLTHLTQSARTWAESGALAVFARRGARNGPPIGTTFGYTLDRAARVHIAFTRLLPGRAVGGRCVAVTRHNRGAHDCTRALAAGSLTHAAHAGANTVRFEGRLTARTRLAHGRYRATFTATRPGGKTSAPLSLTFTIVARTPLARGK